MYKKNDTNVIFLTYISENLSTNSDRMTKREQNKQQNDTAIVQAAIRLFADKGLEATTIGDIVTASGLARGTFYNYYKSKDEIWEKLVEMLAQRVNEAINSLRRQATNAHDFVYEAFMGYAKVLAEPLVLSLIVKNQAAFRKSLFSSHSMVSIYKDLEEDLKNSAFFDYLTPQQYQMISFSMVGAGLEIMVQSFNQDTTFSLQEAGKFFTELFLGGMERMETFSSEKQKVKNEK
ncbi:hypothetical protein BKI52_17385 [marine bacterium AO1-C]|nr:hypothetical protein BKI52_17385 [marine bacterium AO1-C]